MEKQWDSKLTAVCFKVSLADLDFKDTVEFLRINKENVQKADNFYLMDLDIVQDFAGIFEKVEIIRFLIIKYNFNQEGKIFDNLIQRIENKNVGKNCLNFSSLIVFFCFGFGSVNISSDKCENGLL